LSEPESRSPNDERSIPAALRMAITVACAAAAEVGVIAAATLPVKLA
jgi:hypothetical protein